MGKRIISQARGHGSLTYRARPKAYKYKLRYPKINIVGKAKIIKLVDSAGHSAPLAKILIGDEVFYNPAAKNVFEGQEIEVGGKPENGNIVPLNNVAIGAKIFNLEIRKGDGGKIIRGGGGFALVLSKNKGKIKILLPSKKEIILDGENRATVGEIAGAGRLEKPIVKAGKKFYMMRVKGKLWPRTSAVKMNAVDHPFGSGRGKRIKSKIAKRNAPPGKRVGLIRPRKTGKKR